MVIKYGAPDMDLLSFVFENECGDQDKPVLIDAGNPSRFVTPKSGLKITRQLIAGLRANGLKPGDCIYYPMIYLAIIGLGARFTGSNPAYTSLELNHHVHTSHATYLISEPSMLSTVQATAKACNINDEKIFVFDAYDKEPYDQFPYKSWETLLQHGEEDWIKFRDPAKEMRSTIATLAFTSDYAITELPLVPAMMIAILMSPLTKRENLQTLRFIWCGGSPLRSSTQADFQALLAPEAKVTQAWGMTETGWCSVFFWPESDNTGSVGRILPGMDMKLKDLDGNQIYEDNVHGEMYIKGPCMMNGYLDNPTATKAAIDEEGWLRTGDIAYLNKGKVYIIDRAKDLIKVRGWQVAPAELEAILLTHPAVINCAVIGIPVPEGTGEVPRAYVQLKPKPSAEHAAISYGVADEKGPTEDDIKQWVKDRLARYKWLDGGVEFIDDIPRTAAGKVQKVKLRAMKHANGKEGENLKGKKAEDPTAASEGSVDGATEGEKFFEKSMDGANGDV
ncbi:hypothetical protein P7C71_g2338, partial [Lecanoromycetidae sp. Uapishka_2]